MGTTEQVVKNYLRKVYDKLGVADRLELALYCLNNRVLQEPKPEAPTSTSAAPVASAPSTPAKDQTESTSVLDTVENQKKPS